MRTEDDEYPAVSGINVTPLVDITLVLLIIFMVTAVFASEQGLKVELPKTAAGEQAPSPAITVTLGGDGRIFIMKKEVTLDALEAEMRREFGLDSGIKILIKAQKDIPYHRVADALSAIKAAGISRVALAVENK